MLPAVRLSTIDGVRVLTPAFAASDGSLSGVTSADSPSDVAVSREYSSVDTDSCSAVDTDSCSSLVSEAADSVLPDSTALTVDSAGTVSELSVSVELSDNPAISEDPAGADSRSAVFSTTDGSPLAAPHPDSRLQHKNSVITMYLISVFRNTAKIFSPFATIILSITGLFSRQMIDSYIVAYGIRRVAGIFPQTAKQPAYNTFSPDQRLTIRHTHYYPEKKKKKGEAGSFPLLPAHISCNFCLLRLIQSISLRVP